MSETNYQYVIRKLTEREVSLQQVERDTGFPVTWLSKVARRVIPDPRVRRVDQLADYFRLLERQMAERARLKAGAHNIAA